MEEPPKPETQTTFELVGVKLTANEAGTVALRVTVKNVSNETASCSVQLHLQSPSKAAPKSYFMRPQAAGVAKVEKTPIKDVPPQAEVYVDFDPATDFVPPLQVKGAGFVFVVITLIPKRGTKLGPEPERNSTHNVVVGADRR